MSDTMTKLVGEHKLLSAEPTEEMVRAAYKNQPGVINAGFAQAWRDMHAAAPGPGMSGLEAVVLTIAFLNRDKGTDRLPGTIEKLLQQLNAADEGIVNALKRNKENN